MMKENPEYLSYRNAHLEGSRDLAQRRLDFAIKVIAGLVRSGDLTSDQVQQAVLQESTRRIGRLAYEAHVPTARDDARDLLNEIHNSVTQLGGQNNG